MKLRQFGFGLLVGLVTGGVGHAVAADQPLPALPSLPPVASVFPSSLPDLPPVIARGPAGKADQLLEQIYKNMTPPADLFDAPAEASINREMNISRSTGQLLKPVGFMQVGQERIIFASDDGQRVLRLREGSRIGAMRIEKITEDGVDYLVGGKSMFAPLAYTVSEPPKAPQQKNASSSGASQQSPMQQPSPTQSLPNR